MQSETVGASTRADADADGREPESPPVPAPGRRRAGSAGTYLLVGALYLLVSVIVWWHAWSTHPTTVTTCGCGDAAAAIWYTAWPAHAIAHGMNPLYSTAVGYPTGVNLVFAAYGIVLAPLTWLWGPVFALNVLSTAIPVLSALAMFALVRRWVNWTPAAVAAGLLYGFSPFALYHLSAGHIDFGMLAVPPLLALCADDLLTTHRRSPRANGILIGLLVSLQFLVGAEALVLTLAEAVAAGVVLVAWTWYHDRPALQQALGPVARAAGAAAVTTVVCLAFPAWFALAGPAHFNGQVHPGVALNSYRASVTHYLFPIPLLTHGVNSLFVRVVGGYQGPVISAQYLGAGLLMVCFGGWLLWRRDRRLGLFGLLLVFTLVVAVWSGGFLATLPFLGQVIPVHFVLFAYFAGAVMMAVVADRARDAVAGRHPGAGAWAGAGVLGVALLPLVVYLAPALPLTMEPVRVPAWFAAGAPAGAQRVVLPLPAPFTSTRAGQAWRYANGDRFSFGISGKESAMAWQALGGPGYSIVGAGGLGAGVSHAAGENRGQSVISEVTFAYVAPPLVTSGDLRAVHQALTEWGVTTIVLPVQVGLPAYDSVASVTDMAALITGATGLRPRLDAGAWVWQGVRGATPPTFVGGAVYQRCTRSSGAVAVVTGCMAAEIRATP